MRKLIIVGAVVVVLLGGGGWYAKYLVAQKVSDQLVTELNSPDLQKKINQMLKDQKVKTALSSLNHKTAGTTHVTTGSNPGSGASSNKTSTNQQSGESTGPSSSVPALNNRADVVRFAMSRFSTSQVLHFMSMYLNRNHLTGAQRHQLKIEILSHFTPQEIQAMAVAVNK